MQYTRRCITYIKICRRASFVCCMKKQKKLTSWSVQYWHSISPLVLMWLCCHLVNEYEIMAVKEKHCRPKRTTFSAPLGRSPQKCETQCPRQTSVPVQNISQIHSAVSEEMHHKQTDRHTQTANLISVHYRGKIEQRKRTGEHKDVKNTGAEIYLWRKSVG